MCPYLLFSFCYGTTLHLEIDPTVKGGGLGLSESWRAIHQVSVVESVEVYLLYGKEGCAHVKSKIVLFFGDKFLIIIVVEYTLEQGSSTF